MAGLSGRMEAVAGLVTAGSVPADIGTDHAYVPIALVERGRVARAIAMDIGEGPLARARANIAAHGLSDVIAVRLSDGLLALAPGEADSIVIAGMGGALIERILAEGEAVCAHARELILQPQSEIFRVRAFLRTHGFRIETETMLAEGGKYYTAFRAVHGASEDADALSDQYGALLLREKNPVLARFLEKEHTELSRIMTGLAAQDSEAVRRRREEVQGRLSQNERALHIVTKGKL